MQLSGGNYGGLVVDAAKAVSINDGIVYWNYQRSADDVLVAVFAGCSEKLPKGSVDIPVPAAVATEE